MKILILNPYKDSEKIWLGNKPGEIRKVFRVVSPQLVNSTMFVAGITIFEPGEASSLHSHPNSEEIDFVIQGCGEVESEGERKPFKEHDFMFIPKGVEHRHINTCDKPLILLWIYSPPGELPKE